MTFIEAVDYLSDLQAFGWRLDLSRMEALCERLDHPECAFKVVHVAGTNGKGSTTAMIAAILAHAGYKVGSYFSPYVFNVRERVMLAEPQQTARMIPEDDFARLMTELAPHVAAVAEDETIGHPTEFEVKTALAFLYFREQKVDWAVLEVGLGGRLDATNVVPPPEVCVITNIGLDHTERLGDTLEKIAGEKAGIIKPGSAVITGAEEPALGVIRKVYEERGGVTFGRVWHEPERGMRGTLETDGDVSQHHLHVGSLQGPTYQRLNQALATLAVDALRERGFVISDRFTDQALRSVAMPGRFQVVGEQPTVILDGAHNTEAASALAVSLKQRFAGRRITFVIGMMGRHSVDGVVAELVPIASRIIATQPSNERHLPAEQVAKAAAAHGFEAPVMVPPMEALRVALAEARDEDVIVVTGSFYTVGDIDVAAIRPNPPAPFPRREGGAGVDERAGLGMESTTSPLPEGGQEGGGSAAASMSDPSPNAIVRPLPSEGRGLGG